MNYLAHLFLADDNPSSLVGNLIADFIKGPNLDRFPPAVQQGIRLHRQVDSFTDRHPIVQRSIARIGERWGWFSGILIDVWYDHLLSRDWSTWSAIPLRLFVDRTYSALHELLHMFAPEVQASLYRLMERDRLAGYAEIPNIADSLTHLSGRIMARIPNRVVRLQDAVEDLCTHGEGLNSDFATFFPDLIGFSATWKRDNPVAVVGVSE